MLAGAIPPNWRETVHGDLLEEWERGGGSRGRLGLWVRLVRVGIRLRLRQLQRRLSPAVSSQGGAGWRPESLVQDLRHAFRTLHRSPSLTLLTVLTIGVAVGATSGIFAIIHTVLLKPLPYPDSGRIVQLSASLHGPEKKDFPEEAFERLREDSETLEALAYYRELELTVTGNGVATVVGAAAVSAGLADVLGVRVALGRPFRPEEEPEGDNRVAIVSHRFWASRLGGDPAVLTKRLRVDGVEHQVVGVLEPGAGFPDPQTDLWVPYALRSSGAFSFSVTPALARLREGVSSGQALAEVDTIVRGEWNALRAVQEDAHIEVVRLQEARARAIRPALLFIFAGVGLMLLIGCANVANMLLAATSERRGEFALRRALGAGRWRIIQQLFVHSLTLAVLGAGAGLVLANWALAAVAALDPSEIPRLEEVTLDRTVVLFSLGLSVLTAVAFGLFPALDSSRRESGEALHALPRGSSRPGPLRLRRALIIGETASALVLLITAGLLLNSFVRLISVNPGYDPDGVLTARIQLPQSRYPTAAARQFFESLRERLEGHPAVQTVGLGSGPPFSRQWTMVSGLRVDGRPLQGTSVMTVQYASPAFFRALRLQVLEGRSYDESDVRAEPRPAVVNASFVRRYLDPGRTLGSTINHPAGEFRVIGVVADCKQGSLDEETAPQIYLPFRFKSDSSAFVVLRTTGDPMALAATLTGAAQALDGEVLPERIASLRSLLTGSLSQPRFYVAVALALGAVAVILVTVGLYGLLSYSVNRRRREIGVRMAVGASSTDILRLVVVESGILMGGGILIGTLASIAVSDFLAGYLFGIGATDVLTYAAVITFLLAVGSIATWIPARRATRVDPTLALRFE